MDIPTTKLTQATFDDIPVSESQEIATSNSIPSRFETEIMMTGAEKPVKKWLLAQGKELSVIEIVPEFKREGEDTATAEPEPAKEFKPLNSTKYPLSLLQRYLRQWETRKAKGIQFKGAAFSTEQAKKRAEDQKEFAEKCDKAIDYFNEQITFRTRPDRANLRALPKKKQRSLGILPPL